ncbi:MAG TPA: non-ribosomal peptide synthetase, partial [Longimicrobium sp.]|nr:non-ribosomal peptide synthetase [Longimicrobium sp.]
MSNYEPVHQIVRRAAERHPESAAFERGGATITFGELEARAGTLAALLAAGGAAPGTPVAILTDDPARVTACILAALKERCVFVPFDPTLPDGRLAAMAEVARPAWVLAGEALRARARELAGAEARVVSLDQAFADSPGGTDHPGLDSHPDDKCNIFFTSGSTGVPKGIAGRLRGIDHFARWEARLLGAGPGIRGSQLASPSFDSFLRDVFVPLCAGGTVCVPEGRGVAHDGRALAGYVHEARIHVLHCVPSVFRSLLNEPLHAGLFPELRHVVMAGEPLLPSDVARWMDVFGERVELVNLYGPTETTLTKLFHRVRPEDRDRRSVPIGRPMPGAAAVVLDASGAPCSPGVVGEIYLRTPYRAHGYHGRPELTAEVFVANPLTGDPDDVVYRTGDLGRELEDGALDFVGRRDQQIKVRGVRVEPGEVESQLRAHPAVRDVAVRDWTDPRGERALYACVVSPGTPAQDLREHLLAVLPAVMVPAAFVFMDALPRTPNGKVDRAALPLPGGDGAVEPAGYLAPRTVVEEVLAGIWAEVLGVERVGADDDFFERGGHSLLVGRVMGAIEEMFAVSLPLRSLFEGPTVAAQASLLVASQERPGRVERTAEMVRRIAMLSADEVMGMLE